MTPALEKWRIITVNYNLPGDTIELVQSLQAAGACLSQVVVVDNASTDNSIDQIRAALGHEVVIIASDTNQGYAGGINLGVEYALAHDCEWLLLMNNDTIAPPDFFTTLAAAAGGPYRLLGPAILYYDDPQTVWSMGDRLLPGTLFGYDSYRNRPLKPGLNRLIPVDFLNGCCMLVHRSVFEKVGLWETSYYMYGEEVDFCWRARQAGFAQAVAPAARLLHKVSRSARQIGSRAIYLRVRNQNRFYRRYSSRLQQPVMAVLSLLRNSLFSVRRLAQGCGRQSFIPLAGWLDGWFR